MRRGRASAPTLSSAILPVSGSSRAILPAMNWENQTPLAAPNVTTEERRMLEPYWDWCRQFAAGAS